MLKKFNASEFDPSNVMVLYHGPNCLDGFGAAYAAWRMLSNSAAYLPADYGDAPPNVAGKDVFILDFSYPRDVLEAMAQSAKSLVVLDHHKTAEESLRDLPYTYFDMDKSGAVLAWEYFHPATDTPLLLLHIQDQDLCRFNMYNTKAICAALSAKSFSFGAWDCIVAYDFDFSATRQIGEFIVDLFDKDVEELFSRKHLQFYTKPSENVDGFSPLALACNAPPKFASELGNKLAKHQDTWIVPVRHDFGAVYSFDGVRRKWQFSLRSVGDFDVSEVAKVYGGGGHKNAAGFSVTRLEDL
jgi:oligoribonuclease NrnB/cAMP/cGMP phosphodiesterase (DHH superfamily)